MISYHDCPPHPCETLDDVHDARWIRIVERNIEAFVERLDAAMVSLVAETSYNFLDKVKEMDLG